MALIRLEQILSNLSYNTGSNQLKVSGSLNIEQTDPLYPALQLHTVFAPLLNAGHSCAAQVLE